MEFGAEYFPEALISLLRSGHMGAIAMEPQHVSKL
ncbi:MAG: hypothetical protein ACI883_001258 [Candidatus Azotimanducaceae bacterium]|jgi:hypothetical protein|tara:strand:- start:53 stop:157 length:105 start_codon:yes stop_codon:yes gene_type:complete